MGEFVLFIAIFIGVMVLAMVVFGGWAIFSIARWIGGMMGITTEPQPLEPRRPSGAVRIGPVRKNDRVCQYELCKSGNDPAAKFCRRCGRKMTNQHVNVRRVAAL